MKEFECLGLDGKTYMHYDKWHEWRNRYDAEHPKPEGTFRFDVEIAFPKLSLGEVPIDRNPHAFHDKVLRETTNITGHTCYYSCPDWSILNDTITSAHHPADPNGGLRMIVQSGYSWEARHTTRIRLMSTSGQIDPEPWGMNPSNRFAYLNGQFFKVMNFERMHDWEEGRANGYPLTNQPGPWSKHPNAMPPELLFQETENMLEYHYVASSYNKKFPEQGVKILYEDPNWVYATWTHSVSNENDGDGDGNSIIILGTCHYVVWKHWSDYTGETMFLSITPMDTFPFAFSNIRDLVKGIISPQQIDGPKQDMTKFLVERIVHGTERSKTIHFKVIETIGPPLIQPNWLRSPELIA